MNSLLLLSSMVLAAPTQDAVKMPAIVEAALYKNGFSALMRKVDLDADGETMIGGIKPAVSGTFWVFGSPGVRVESLVNTTVSDKVELTASSIPAILGLNLGATVSLETKSGTVTGKLVEFNSVAVLENETGTVLIASADIVRATIQGKAVVKFAGQTSTPGLRVKANGPGTLYMLSVEPGLSWVPQYWVDILDDSRLKFTMRTSVSNEIGDLKDANVSFVAGAPNMPNLFDVDPFTLFREAGRRGSFGGIGGGGGGMMQNAAPAAAEMGRSPFEVDAASGTSLGELFYYKSNKVSLKEGEKGYFVLFESATTYRTVYALNAQVDQAGEAPLEAWQTIKFQNTSGVPLTSAVATAYRNQNLVGQDNLLYTPSGAETTLRLARAVDIPAQINISETSRDSLNLNNNLRTRVTRDAKIEVRNQKREDAMMEINLTATGEVLGAPVGAQVRRLGDQLNDLNPQTQIRWQVRLKPNEARTFSFQYRRIL